MDISPTNIQKFSKAELDELNNFNEICELNDLNSNSSDLNIDSNTHIDFDSCNVNELIKEMNSVNLVNPLNTVNYF